MVASSNHQIIEPNPSMLQTYVTSTRPVAVSVQSSDKHS
uniref:Uncharacterized protein n=1 Tax=Setaria italica TaxID=4555 RepID=K4APJ5_SETIT